MPWKEDTTAPRLYGELAWLWPYWEPVEDYRVESENYASLLRRHARIAPKTILDLGCGGGKTAYHLARHFALTGVDISPAMLEQARRLNPEAEFIVGDMRVLELGREFDAVFVNDAVAYMKTLDELEAVFQTAWKHLRPGGAMLAVPDHTRETFQQNSTQVWTGGDERFDLTFIENEYDPDPSDTLIEALHIYLIRERGRLRVERDVHVLGMFSIEDWRRLLARTGYAVFEERHVGMDDRPAHEPPVLICVKPT